MEMTEMKKFNDPSAMQTNKNKQHNSGFSLIELIIVIAIMAILVGVMAPSLLSYIHKARVSTDWANLRAYYSELEADFVSTGEYNPNVPIVHGGSGTWDNREIHFLSGQTVKMKAGYFAVTEAASGSGYQISYYCDKCLTDWAKHKDSCTLVLGARG